MKSSTHAIAVSAIDAAFEMLRTEGLAEESAKLIGDLRHELDARDHAATALLITPSGDAGEAVAAAQNVLEQKLGKTITIHQQADASLLGGWILEYGDMRIDRSMRGALHKAKQHLEQSSSH